jgi:magnesium transporter
MSIFLSTCVATLLAEGSSVNAPLTDDGQQETVTTTPHQVASPLAEMLDRLPNGSQAPTGQQLRRGFGEQRAHLLHLSTGPTAWVTCWPGVAGQPDRGVGAPERRHAPDLGLVAIWAIPTLLAGIYGMNFRHRPELEWRFGYRLVLVTMAVIRLGLDRAFRCSGWL